MDAVTRLTAVIATGLALMPGILIFLTYALRILRLPQLWLEEDLPQERRAASCRGARYPGAASARPRHRARARAGGPQGGRAALPGTRGRDQRAPPDAARPHERPRTPAEQFGRGAARP